MESRIPLTSATALPDIEDVPPLNDDDRACIEEVTEVLKKHGSLSRFGLMLLHQHFDLGAGEVMLEECDPVSRTLTIRPKPVVELEKIAFRHTSWRLDSNGPVMHCACRTDPDTGSHNHYHVR